MSILKDRHPQQDRDTYPREVFIGSETRTLPTTADFLLDSILVDVNTNKLLTDEQIDELFAICDPPADQLRANIAQEFERAALVLVSERTVGGNRKERQAFQNELGAAQRCAKKLSSIIANMNPKLENGLNGKLENAQKRSGKPIALIDIKCLLDAIVDSDLAYQPGVKSDDVLAWVVGGLIHAIDTRLTPSFDSYGVRKRGKWFSEARKAKLIFTFFRTVDPDKFKHVNLEYISHLVKNSKQVKATRLKPKTTV